MAAREVEKVVATAVAGRAVAMKAAGMQAVVTAVAAMVVVWEAETEVETVAVEACSHLCGR